ncbi:hypothetical protein [Galbitalea soli]|uniref:Uncharacterized protein n=1 Tax=Galbitalea soli TaxID=1268042 RepID=A0A7C9PMG3_9MICO|nr:hypothetical protein [Galbitalea soli]NEM90709.1 hypothetical protein [Galbitalea soli]NYJ31427.1 hypothetical protein [Galbitalea soli]
MEPASKTFEAELVEHRPGGVLRLAPPIAPFELVVRRRADGSELIRTPAELDAPELLLDTVRRDLDEMTVDEFIAEWKMPDSL